MADSANGGTGLDPVMEVLIAQLRRNGALTTADLDSMKRRLIEGDRPDLARGIDGVILSDIFDDPDMRRATIHGIDGGKAGD